MEQVCAVRYCPMARLPDYCATCERETTVSGAEYAYGDPNRYDGISEWVCLVCGRREGRWTGKELKDGEAEPRFGGPPSGATYE
jgi:hypothetical protein